MAIFVKQTSKKNYYECFQDKNWNNTRATKYLK